MSSVNSGIKPKDHFIKRPRYPNSLTTVVGINCKDGIVLCADSQETHYEADQPRFKRLIQKKLSDIGTNRRYMIGCAGSSTDLELLIEFLNEHKELIGETMFDERGFHDLLETQVMSEFLEKHNVELPRRTHGSATSYPIDVDALFAAQLEGNPKHMLYKIETNQRLIIRRVPMYGSIGSGSEIVNPLLDQLNRQLIDLKYDWHKLNTKLVAKITSLILGIGLSVDFATGGTIDCRILNDEEGVMQATRTQVWDDKKPSMMETLVLACNELPELKDKMRDMVTKLQSPSSQAKK